MASIEIAGESALRIVWAETPSPDLTARILGIIKSLDRTLPMGATQSVPGYQSLVVHFNRDQLGRGELTTFLEAQVETRDVTALRGNDVLLPVLYDPEVAPDLVWLAERAGLSVDEVIAQHSGIPYHAYANGFAPGFCYLGQVPEVLSAPRLASPRATVPAGAVGIADRQTGVYPRPSPAGWRIIGRCPTPLFSANATPPNRISVGDTVRFTPIDRAQFQSLGGVL